MCSRDQLATGFEQHPDAVVVRSLPGLGTILGARVLGEFGDEPNRYLDAKSRKNYAGTSPITRASGTKRAVLARHVRNQRLADAIDAWAFASLTVSPGARKLYDAHRAAGDTHHMALRALGNRLVGILHGCLTHHRRYDETIAWGHRADHPHQRSLDKLGNVGYLDPPQRSLPRGVKIPPGRAPQLRKAIKTRYQHPSRRLSSDSRSGRRMLAVAHCDARHARATQTAGLDPPAPSRTAPLCPYACAGSMTAVPSRLGTTPRSTDQI